MKTASLDEPSEGHERLGKNMEIYTGVKFKCLQSGSTFPYGLRLAQLNAWAFILAGLGLTPVHPGGAYGNQSYRLDDTSLIITASGMTPEKDLVPENYVLIEGLDEQGGLHTKGVRKPSSESLLHYSIYREFPDAGAIMHGHSRLLEQYATNLAIPVTTTFQPYGTSALAESAVDLLREGTGFILLKDHGFVATGKDIDTTGKVVLDYYERLIAVLKKRRPYQVS
jgi:ribulose-5-phosphate 4-epimerase/fuculose-1-phosphate aldolase